MLEGGGSTNVTITNISSLKAKWPIHILPVFNLTPTEFHIPEKECYKIRN